MREVDTSFLDPQSDHAGNRQLASVRPSIAALNATQKIKNVPSGARQTRSCAEIVRRFLTSKNRASLDEKGRTRFIRMLDNMVTIASGKSPQAVAAFTALCDRAYGKARPHDDELDALTKGGIQIVYVAPTELDGEIREARNIPPPKPDFIEAEFQEEAGG